MTSKNDITGDKQSTKASTEAYRENYDKIFGEKANRQQRSDGVIKESWVDGKWIISEYERKESSK